MSLTTGANNLNSAAVKGQVEVSMLMNSSIIIQEASNVPLHDKRSRVADAIIYRQATGAAIIGTMLRLVIAANAAVRDAVTPTDAQVDTAVTNLLANEKALDALIVI